jgi:glycosyltransferase involved in cell wall biosynthesis
MRGFVEDIIAEIFSSHVFLVVNPINLGIRVRVPYAWSMGACVISHQVNISGLPEMIHEKNALLGKNAPEIVDQILKIYQDADLRKRLEEGGRKTYDEFFSFKVTTGKILGEFERICK